jgi:hypothetical protein
MEEASKKRKSDQTIVEPPQKKLKVEEGIR